MIIVLPLGSCSIDTELKKSEFRNIQFGKVDDELVNKKANIWKNYNKFLGI